MTRTHRGLGGVANHEPQAVSSRRHFTGVIVMPTIQIEANLSSEQLLNAAGQMPRREFNRFVEAVLRLRANHERGKLSVGEAELLSKINQPVPADVQQRYDELIERRDARLLSTDEQQELLCLTDQVELLEAERMKRLIELAQLRQVSLDEVFKQLGLPPLSYV